MWKSPTCTSPLCNSVYLSSERQQRLSPYKCGSISWIFDWTMNYRLRSINFCNLTAGMSWRELQVISVQHKINIGIPSDVLHLPSAAACLGESMYVGIFLVELLGIPSQEQLVSAPALCSWPWTIQQLFGSLCGMVTYLYGYIIFITH